MLDLGWTVNFKTYTKSLKFKKHLETPIEDWLIFEDTQPIIIKKRQLEQLQQLRENKRRFCFRMGNIPITVKIHYRMNQPKPVGM